MKGATTYQSAFTAPTAPQEVAARLSAYSEPSGPSSGKVSGFAPEYAPAYAPTFFGSAKGVTTGATAHQGFSAPASSYQGVSAPTSSYYAPQGNTVSESSGGASGFAPLFAPAYAPGFFGSARTSGASAPVFRDVPQAPTASYSGASASASAFAPPLSPREGAASSSRGEGGASGFAPLFAPSYSSGFFGQKSQLDATLTSPNVVGILAVTLMGLAIGISALCCTFAALPQPVTMSSSRLHRIDQ